MAVDSLAQITDGSGQVEIEVEWDQTGDGTGLLTKFSISNDTTRQFRLILVRANGTTWRNVVVPPGQTIEVPPAGPVSRYEHIGSIGLREE